MRWLLVVGAFVGVAVLELLAAWIYARAKKRPLAAVLSEWSEWLES